MKKIIEGVYRIGKNIATRALVKGKVYDEKIIRKGKEEYRIWNPRKSKLSAAIHKGLKDLPLKKSNKVLYLGIANGTTASHISDIIGRKGVIYGVDISPRSIGDLVRVAERRKNIIPILEDAHFPLHYAPLIEKVDVLYVDVAQPDQTDITLRNASAFLRERGWLMMAIKARSISVSKKPREVFRNELSKLESIFSISSTLYLDPWEKDHMFVVAQKR